MESIDIGKVLEVYDEYNLLINMGQEHDICVGDDVIVFAVGEPVVDPDTGESLGNYEWQKARLTVTKVMPRFSEARSQRRQSGGLVTLQFLSTADTVKDVAFAVDESVVSKRRDARDMIVRPKDLVRVVRNRD
ncbi:MAG: hypothetical protein ACYC63_07575 [Armatimonadota bacterium]